MLKICAIIVEIAAKLVRVSFSNESYMVQILFAYSAGTIRRSEFFDF